MDSKLDGAVPMLASSVRNVGEEMKESLAGPDPLIKTAHNLETAVKKAKRAERTDEVLIFDGSFGHLNLSPSPADELVKKAPRSAGGWRRSCCPYG